MSRPAAAEAPAQPIAVGRSAPSPGDPNAARPTSAAMARPAALPSTPMVVASAAAKLIC
jgi:hypothetical protein